ncbi:putative DNA repair protein Nse1 [Thozetella sp. PMI_491]|nr:putative DNA repair protein Nse1 [Thozetella sp. PMI_491]
MDDWQPSVPDNYDDKNRAFLQALLAHGTMTFGQGQQTIAGILRAAEEEAVDPASVTMDEFSEYIDKAREAVSQLDLEIRSSQHQVTKERIWALINTQSDSSTQMATTHSADEIAYINRLLNAMFDKYNTPRMEVMAVDEKQAIKVARPPPRESQAGGPDDEANTQAAPTDRGLKHSEVITLLRSLVEEGWLEDSEAGFYSLSPRALMELRSWLVTTFNDEDGEGWQRIKFCMACKEIITVGQRCAERDCTARIHDICSRPYWHSRKDKKCQKCQTEWDGRHFVGERAVTSTEAYQRGPGKKRRGRGSAANGTQQDEDPTNGESSRANGLDEEGDVEMGQQNREDEDEDEAEDDE